MLLPLLSDMYTDRWFNLRPSVIVVSQEQLDKYKQEEVDNTIKALTVQRDELDKKIEELKKKEKANADAP
tara:strand:- start:151 stop:360 length:210 start_codon:yes stop_codon:yes gene_type:complete